MRLFKKWLRQMALLPKESTQALTDEMLKYNGFNKLKRVQKSDFLGGKNESTRHKGSKG